MQLALLVLILLIAVYVFTFPKYEISSIAISYFAIILCYSDAFLYLSDSYAF